MFSQISKSLVICTVFGLMGCKTINSTNDIGVNNPFGDLIISEPLQVDFKKEVALARISDVLRSGKLSSEQQAQAFYDRGLLFDSFGLPTLARLDFNRALRSNPKMADAYNFVGVHYTLIGDFEKAYESFDATIELAPQHQYAYLNRGIALYYGGNDQLAVDDFKTFSQFDKSDPYRMIWRYLAEYKLDKVLATTNLSLNRVNIDDNEWGGQIADLYLMNISQSEFIAGLTKNVKSQNQLAERLCEAYFYLGIYARMHGQPELALNYFRLALSTNVFEFIEHRYARQELFNTRIELIKTKNTLIETKS